MLAELEVSTYRFDENAGRRCHRLVLGCLVFRSVVDEYSIVV